MGKENYQPLAFINNSKMIDLCCNLKRLNIIKNKKEG